MEKQIKELSHKVDMLLWQYIPNRDDDIDIALANFINTYPERNKMKIMFLRESSGVYQFGHRRVHIDIQ